jgi:hypothetical protein
MSAFGSKLDALCWTISAVVRITQPQFVKTAPAGAAFDRDLAFDSIVA